MANTHSGTLKLQDRLRWVAQVIARPTVGPASPTELYFLRADLCTDRSPCFRLGVVLNLPQYSLIRYIVTWPLITP